MPVKSLQWGIIVLVVHCSNSLPSPPVTQWGLQATAGGDMIKGFGGTIYVSSSVVKLTLKIR